MSRSIAIPLIVAVAVFIAGVRWIRSGLPEEIEPEPSTFPRLGVPMIDHEPDLESVKITLSEFCYGCGKPEFDVTLRGSGAGEFVGKAAVSSLGRVEFEFDPDELFRVLKIMDDVDFMRMRHECNWWEPGTTIAVVTLWVGPRAASFAGAQYPSISRLDETNRPEFEFHRRYREVVGAIDRIPPGRLWFKK